MNPWLRAYLLGAVVPASAVTLGLLGQPAGQPGDPALAALLVVLGALAANFPVMVSPRYKADATPAIYLAMVLLFAPSTAVALVGLSRLAGDGALCLRRNPKTQKRRRRPMDLVFNTSQIMLASALAALAYGAITAPNAAGDGL